MEILYSMIYAVLLGSYNIFKKISLKKSRDINILVIYTTISFLLCLTLIPFGVMVPFKHLLVLAAKGFLLATNWYLVLKVLKKVDISVTSITSIISAVMSFVLGLIIFNETASVLQIIGSLIIVVGVYAINLVNKTSGGKLTKITFLLLLVCACISTTSTVIDKFSTSHLTRFQVQFWYMMFVAIGSWFYFIIECIREKQFLIKKADFKNYWIYFLGIFLFFAEMMLFLAYKVPNSKMITISILTKMQAIFTVFFGAIIFKEKNITKKIILSIFVILGAILISVGK